MVRDGVEELGLAEATEVGVSQLVLTACAYYLNYSSFTSPLPSAGIVQVIQVICLYDGTQPGLSVFATAGDPILNTNMP